MGAGLARVLTENGVSVLTLLSGRSAASRERAEAAGMRPVEPGQLARADFLLSVLPPGQALGFAGEMASLLATAPHKPVFVDCNAVNPATARSIETVMAGNGIGFADVGIIGLPPQAGSPGPHLYASGTAAANLAVLKAHGLDIRLLEGPAGTASALKMAYAGITKGLIAVAAAAILGASRAGVAEALHGEMSESQAALLQSLSKRIPDMLPKAYRWVEEMRQISGFVSGQPGASELYQGASELFADIAADLQRDSAAATLLTEFAADR
jgi:3-hydroxyisobutyrate dehydrogenase-like beta-hydroxyacid dehydrogenase